MSKDDTCCEDLQRERAKCSFNLEELTNIVDGGKHLTENRRKIENVLLSEPEFSDAIPVDYLSHEERYANELRKATHLAKVLAEKGLNIRDVFVGHGSSLLKDGNPLALHKTMFIGALAGQGTKEQNEKWLPLARNYKIIGCYAQTEMGHGTFIRGLETTATYDPVTQEFILHSPTITSTKWWPGGLGKTSNYGVVMAQLYTQGKCYGPHPFMVQLRDMETHHTLPGLTLGEIGPRLGLNTNDIGFLRFEHHRIPRTNMLMKHSQVLESGEYVKPLHSKLSYGTMVQTRVGIVSAVFKNLQKAVTIATRYSAVRHQSEIVPGEPEPQILDYVTQQYKLLPQIASVFALMFSANALIQVYLDAMTQLDGGKVHLLPELHALSSGLKAIASNDSSNGIEICRLACGGHGYLSSSNLPRLYTGTTCAITYEGENTVLLLQVARYLVKSFRAISLGQTVPASVSYLSVQPSSSCASELSNTELVNALGRGSQWLVSRVASQMQKLEAKGLQSHHASNSSSIHLVQCAEAHTRYFICDRFVKKVEELSESASKGVSEVLAQLCRLYLIKQSINSSGLLIRCGALDGDSMSQLEDEMCEVLRTLRPQAVNIVDAFDISDDFLDSTLGAWDGNVYQRLYDEAMKSPLNKTDVPQAYYQYLRPLMKSNL